MNDNHLSFPRILVLGAGGTGGYFGGRLASAGMDVSFLVRPQRAAQLQRDGLNIRSVLGDVSIAVNHITADALPRLACTQPFDLVILSCKAYDLDGAMTAMAPAVGVTTTILPILNGLRHYPMLDSQFGQDAVLGGLCFINAAKAEDGAILHLGVPARLVFGERNHIKSVRVQALAAACAKANIEHVASTEIILEQWIKYTFLVAFAAGTCLMRADIGTIVTTDHGIWLMRSLYLECLAVAEAAGHPIPVQAQKINLGLLLQTGSTGKASMLRDLESGQQVEAEHVIGDMLERAHAVGLSVPLLQTAYCHLQAYQQQREHQYGD